MGLDRYYRTSLPRSAVAGLIAAKNTFGDVEGGNYAEFESDGTLFFYGDATVWDDMRVSATTTRFAANAPGFTAWKDGLFLPWFDKTTPEMVYFNVQLPHGWREETGISAHVHWVPKTSQTNQTVCWGLEYSWTNIGEVFPSSLIVYGNTITVPNGTTSPVANTQCLTSLAVLPGTGLGLSSMLVCRLFRDATSVYATDNYDDDAGLLEIDFHIEKDALGSRLLFTK